VIELFELPKTPIALTIGMFDGVHLGHQQLLKKLLATGQKTAILTFIPHPREVLSPSHSSPLQLTTHAQKKKLLEKLGIHFLITLPFTREFAQTRYDQILNSIPFTHLILGRGSAFGYKREGTEIAVRAWAKNRPVTIEYLPKFELDGAPVSSIRIRNALMTGDRPLAERLLGYPLTFLEESHV
jgi:riboflavin kinase/FMN adenylyltransferase